MNRRNPPSRGRTAAPATPNRLKVSPKRERRERNRRKPDVWGAVRLLLVAALVGQGLRVAFASPRLRLQEVRVAGTERIKAADVVRWAGVPVGENIFRANLVRVSGRLEQEPIVREAVVTRELPNTLRVEIAERVPALQVTSSRGRFHADREGVVFQPAFTLSSKMPLLEVPDADLPQIGGKLRPELVKTAWRCTQLAARDKLALTKMRIDDAGELWLDIATYPTSQTAAGTLTVRVGRSTELAEKFRDIRQAMQGWPDLTASAAYLNVMCAGRPAYMKLSKADETAPR